MKKKEWEDYPEPIRQPEAGCLRWQGPHHTNGYGKVGSTRYAHRVAWERKNGPIPPSMTVDHVQARGCRYRDCVELSHLDVVTQGENVRRNGVVADEIARTSCPQGHLYAGSNLIVRRGKRECRTCTYDRNMRNYWQRKQARTGSAARQRRKQGRFL